jgi:hypothetical protein
MVCRKYASISTSVVPLCPCSHLWMLVHALFLDHDAAIWIGSFN